MGSGIILSDDFDGRGAVLISRSGPRHRLSTDQLVKKKDGNHLEAMLL